MPQKRRPRKRLSWWQPFLDEFPVIFGTRAGWTALICLAIGILSTPWLLVALLFVAAAGVLFAFTIRSAHRAKPPSIFNG